MSLLYVIMGLMVGGWGARVPEIRERVGAGEASWGLANSVSAVGDVVALGLVVVLVGRVNARRMSLVGAMGVVLSAPFLGFAPTLSAVVAALLGWYSCAQLMATPMGAQAVEVQRRYGRPLLASFNACFSIAVFAGAGLGAGAAAIGLRPGIQFAVTGAVLGVLLLITGRWLPGEPPPPARRGTRRTRIRDRLTPQLRLIALLSFLSGFVMSVSTQWSALYVADEARAGAALGGACYAVMSVAGVLALLAGDRLTARVDRRVLLRGTSLLAAGGLALAIVAGTPVAAMAGLTVFAIGIAGTSPIIDGFAAQQPNVTATEGISVSEAGQMPGFFISPALIGALAGTVGLKYALILPVLTLTGTALLAARLKATPGSVYSDGASTSGR
ncbi:MULTISPECIES: MFS transporter [Actinomadura]|uniref:MFS transporter n=1 Tax=Actinomadura yumaensis TaxID=111807 RepID=A0ABW2CJ01_9ACTN|nr:MFS transporter [Actinomadura sp. J1-007]MWK39861.1 MFS transporter [Actinomadura sp. J1-007]